MDTDIRRFVLISLVAALLAGCGGPSQADFQAGVQATEAAAATKEAAAAKNEAEAADPCADAALMAYADAIDEKLRTFESQIAVTDASPRVSIATPLQKLVDIQQDTRRIQAPECLTVFHDRVIAMMGLYRTAYETFAAQGNQHKIATSRAAGAVELQAIHDGLANIRAGEIPPDPPPTPVVTPGQGVING
jgi:hypothetical protein